MDVGRTGIWSIELRTEAPGAIQDAAAELDAMGWGALWIPGLGGGDIIGDAERLLSVTGGTKVAVGVLSIWRHRAAEMAAGHARLRERYGSRLMLGLGVSDPAAAREAGRDYRPLSDMGGYLDELDAAPAPVPSDERLMAALGPRMVQLAARRTAGVHPFLVTPEYSAATRELLGEGPLLAPYQAVVLDPDPITARAAARDFLGMFLSMGHYARNLLRQGFTEEDLADGGSDPLIDSVVAWGDVEAVGNRVRAHHQAGADHVCLHVLGGDSGMPLPQWRELAALAR
ncbi:TIGR03620 family F420-dependent LLM class oxidoreductase [Streptacidiphilus sp. ASG 303]|uniref:TIGR03620 family F420-dependent LLM class oxidoreductase n=1 Tax=Streptacidiphilus sp. ASG 303 TaxID=2896847 RepID=UPI001E43E626|nr:TIGR03620 family F420-dependent LLM class oxidoreductase [Streptacidiphilus sp. ASG 303]MCD0484120.1 TIGR03620 family F420-dependent LLM class oxidoreductase [Streptacidiphilus sp. ASG 303]